MDLVKNLQAIENARRVECQGCLTLVPHVDAECMLCDGCIQDADDKLMEDIEDRGWTDSEADADTLASAGMGTDEDYGFFGGEE